MSKIVINELDEQADRTYLHCHYDGQYSAQPCFVELDADGRVSADYDGNLGGVPASVWHGRDRRYAIPALTADAANRVMHALEGLLQVVHDGRAIEWDGANLVGRLSAEAEEAEEQIEDMLREGGPNAVWTQDEVVSEWDVRDWEQRSIDDLDPDEVLVILTDPDGAEEAWAAECWEQVSGVLTGWDSFVEQVQEGWAVVDGVAKLREDHDD